MVNLIRKMEEDTVEYLRDESRTVGHAESISFPQEEADVINLLRELSATHTPVTIQGGRTGLSAAAVPFGGHIMNLSRMNRVTAIRGNAKEGFRLRVQPGVVLMQLRKMIESRRFEASDTACWDDESQAAFRRFAKASEYFFSPDPTEASATIGGLVACNASGARSFAYGATRPHITALRVVLADGDTLELHRGETRACGRRITLVTEQGRAIEAVLPGYTMPETKNASGYYICDDMDAIDLFIGSDGTLGVITEIEISLLPLPQVIWAVSCFLPDEAMAPSLVDTVRSQIKQVVAIEYFNHGALDLLAKQREAGGAFASLPVVPEGMRAAVYFELHCSDEDEAQTALFAIGDRLTAVGGAEGDTWVARTASDRDRLIFFRHAVPETANMLIDQRKKLHPSIVKVGTDMAVPDRELASVMQMYDRDLIENNLEYAIWGHIGNNHLHVNILPNDEAELARARELYARWVKHVSALGGAVSAEHGVGKTKAKYLIDMYGEQAVREMAGLKRAFDPDLILGRGNLFAYEIAEGGIA